MSKKIWSLILVVAMVLSMMSVSAFAADGDENAAYDSDFAADTIEIGTADELIAFAAYVNGGNGVINKTVNLTADITFADITFAEGAEWTPIEYSNGTFTINGNSHTIYNLPGMLINKTGSGGHHLIVNDITFDGAKVNEGGNAAVIIGYADAVNELTFNNVTIKNSTVKGTNYAAAFVGYAAGYGVRDNGPVFQEVTFKNCTVEKNTITGGGSTGALMGHAAGNTDAVIRVTGTTVTGNTIKSTGSTNNKAGSLFGTAGNAGAVPGISGQTTGIFVSANVSGNTVTSGGEEITTICGRQGSSGGRMWLTGGSYDSAPITAADSAWAFVADGLTLAENEGTWTVKENIFAASEITITTAAELAEFAEYVNAGNDMAGKTVKLGNNIDMSGVAFAPIGNTTAFNGTFDGQNCTISNLNINMPEKNYVALFGKINTSGVIKNVIVEKATITGYQYVAGIVGYSHHNVENCVVSGSTIKAVEQVAGICGFSICGTFKGNTVDGCTIQAEVDRAAGVLAKLDCQSSTYVLNNTVKNSTIIAGQYHNDCGAASIVSQVMSTGDYKIWDNKTIDVVTKTADTENFAPVISNYRDAKFDINGETKILRNKWSYTEEKPSSYVVAKDSNSVTIVNYKPVAQIGDVEYITLAEAVAAVPADNTETTITLLADTTGSGVKVQAGQNIVFDLNGKTYTVNQTVGSAGTETNGFQLLKDSKVTFKNGTVKSDNAKILIQNYSNLTLNNVTLDGSGLAGDTPYTLSTNNGSTVIEDTTIIAKDGGVAFDVCSFGNYTGNTVTVKSGSVIKGKIELSTTNDAPLALNINGGNFTNADIVVSENGEKVAVTKAANAAIAAPVGYMWDAAGAMVKIPPVAQIGDVEYTTLAEAVAAVPADNTETTITLLADTTGNGVKVQAGQNIVFDLNGKTYTVNQTVGSAGTETNGFQLLKDSKVTFKNGTVKSDNAKILIQNYSNLTLNKVTLDGSGLVGVKPYTLSTNNGSTVIEDTTIIAKAGGVAFDVCSFGNYTGNTVTVKGDSVINGAIELSTTNNAPLALNINGGNFTNADIVVSENGEKVAVTKAANAAIAAPVGYMWDAAGAMVKIPPVAQIGDVEYTTLAEAVAAVPADNTETTITLLADTTGSGVKVQAGQNIVFDLNGKTYTVNQTVGSAGTETNGFQLLKDSKVTFKNGTVKSESAKILIQNYSNLTLNKVTLDGSGLADVTPYTLSTNNGSTVIEDTTIIAKAGGVAFDVCSFGNYTGNTVTVKGNSVINGKIELSTSNDAPLALKIEGGNFTNADIVVSTNGDKVAVTKAANAAIAAPDGYMWNAAGSMVKISTLGDVISVTAVAVDRDNATDDVEVYENDSVTVTVGITQAAVGIHMEIAVSDKFEVVSASGCEKIGNGTYQASDVKTFPEGTVATLTLKAIGQNANNVTVDEIVTVKKANIAFTEEDAMYGNAPDYAQNTVYNNNSAIIIYRDFDVSAADLTVTYDAEEHTVSVIVADKDKSSTAYVTEAMYTVTGVESKTNAGEYIFSYTVTPAAGVRYNAITGTAKLIINKATLTVTAPQAKTGLVYDGSAKALVDAGKVIPALAAMKYKLSGAAEWSTEIPTATDAGNYTVDWMVETSDNYTIDGAASGSVENIEIAKEEIVLESTPATEKTLTYTGENQDLIEAISVTSPENVTVTYSLNGAKATENVPTAMNVGTYVVTWTVSAGDNYAEKSGSVTVKIKAATITDDMYTTPTANTGLKYDGSQQELVNGGSVAEGAPADMKILYSTDGTNWSETVPAATAVGDYTVYYKVTATGYETVGPVSLGTVSIAKGTIDPADVVETAPVAIDAVYDGSAKPLVSEAVIKSDATPAVTVKYAASEAGPWSDTVPTATDAGNYNVYYKLSAEGYDDYISNPIPVAISNPEIKYSKSEYIAGHTLVLVFTNDTAKATYDGVVMYDMSDMGYALNDAAVAMKGSADATSYTYVYGILVDGTGNEALIGIAPATANAIKVNPSPITVDQFLDINISKSVDLFDAVADQAVYNQNQNYLSARMDIVLRADVNKNGIVNTEDLILIMNAYKVDLVSAN